VNRADRSSRAPRLSHRAKGPIKPFSFGATLRPACNLAPSLRNFCGHLLTQTCRPVVTGCRRSRQKKMPRRRGQSQNLRQRGRVGKLPHPDSRRITPALKIGNAARYPLTIGTMPAPTSSPTTNTTAATATAPSTSTTCVSCDPCLRRTIQDNGWRRSGNGAIS
jgi:hypothetical protein